ncbi:MAG: NAD(P)/FAD-dependent oxidoreductase [Pegethrix bostrychoides GSE-TBD4-15B]|jgi:protoporphyrinogen oxidase|uniref:NAD(P)/FAD-dependent oxidoreductase n=1 Tax=Pegethrix bostrychoides GSE-TBD4-15B TaxID=2839662 RepID=A0A951PCQ8_9CYAN|nr:NAD(P)/FAD-dependent oxidoreductase [Pegethrix bostrychoides GSE-TBD4-15B]
MSSSHSERWAIVGGGLLGLTLAHRLAQQGKSVTLFESSSQLGGLASAWILGDIVWDRHYHVTLLSDSHLRGLLQELGLDHQMRWVETKTGCYTDGQLYSVSNAIEFLKFPPLRLLDKLRLGFTILYASKLRDWRPLEKISVADWLTRWSGRRTFEKFWLPLLRAKLGENYQKASAAFIWAIIARLYAARRTGLKKEMFGYLPGGYGRMLHRFGEVLREEGVDLRLGYSATQVRSIPNGQLRIDFLDQPAERFDQVIVTAPAGVAADLCPELLPAERTQLKAIQYQGIICASLLLKRPLSPYYVTNITDSGLPFTGIIEMTTLVDPAEFRGQTLVYLPRYIDPHDPAFERSDAELQAEFVAGLTRIYPQFQPDDVISIRLSRVRNVLAIPTLHYSQQLPNMQSSIPGLHLINSAHILNGTLNVNETVQLAENAAVRLSRHVSTTQIPAL